MKRTMSNKNENKNRKVLFIRYAFMDLVDVMRNFVIQLNFQGE